MLFRSRATRRAELMLAMPMKKRFRFRERADERRGQKTLHGNRARINHHQIVTRAQTLGGFRFNFFGKNRALIVKTQKQCRMHCAKRAHFIGREEAVKRLAFAFQNRLIARKNKCACVFLRVEIFQRDFQKQEMTLKLVVSPLPLIRCWPESKNLSRRESQVKTDFEIGRAHV